MLQHIEIVILGIFPVHPSHAAVHLRGIRVDAIAADMGYRAVIWVFGSRHNGRLFAETEVGERLRGLVAERLSFFRRIDLGQPDFYLLLIRFQNGERIAIGNTNDRGENKAVNMPNSCHVK